MTVKLIQKVGSDRMIVAAAKVSTAGADSEECLNHVANRGLINFLMKNRHGTPFEHGFMTFLVEAPIFVFREFHRHRVGWSYNEMSGRYKQLAPVFYIPDEERDLVQEGKPGHYEFVPGTKEQYLQTKGSLMCAYEEAYDQYEGMLKAGIAKEVARACLPVATYSAMYASCNPRSLMHFLSLRTKAEHAKFPSYPQLEIEMVAEEMEWLFSREFPITFDAYDANGRVAP